MDLNKLFRKKYAPLIFSLICGLSYFVIILRFILTYTANGGALLAFFFFPAITCSTALFIIKSIKNHLDNEAEASLKLLFYSHIFIILFAILLLFSWIIL